MIDGGKLAGDVFGDKKNVSAWLISLHADGDECK